MGWMETLGDVLGAAGKMAQAHQVNQWITADLDSAVAEVEYLASNYPPEIIDSYEGLMLHASCFIFDPNQRIQLMKLYATLKIVETGRFGFRGFSNVEI